MKKQVGLAILAASLLFGGSSLEAVAAGKGLGLQTAPGQSVNFSKGVTTEVVTTEKVTHDQIVATETSSTSTTENKSFSSFVDEDNVVIHSSIEWHPTKNEYREVTVLATVRTTTTSTWDETTTVTTTTTTTTPVTITETITTIVSHQGAPGSNGKVLSESSTPTINKVEGEPVVTSNSITAVTSGEVTTSTKTENLNVREEKSGWKIGQR